MAAFLTPRQTTILRRLADGLGLPAHVPRPRDFAQDVESLRLLGFVASDAGTLSIAPAGRECLAAFELDASPPPLANLRVVHGRDHSISVERWPQEYWMADS